MQFDKNLLYQVMNVQSTSGETHRMEKFVLKFAQRRGDILVEQDTAGNIYLTKSNGTFDTYPCVVAHMDTVHPLIPNRDFTILSHDGTWFAYDVGNRCLTGIGGDDKVGVFIALSALVQKDHIKVALFVDEEVGCVGSSQADMSFFLDCSFVLECDRRGYGEFVSNISGTELYSEAFEKAALPYLMRWGFKPHSWGGLTDVAQLKWNGLTVSAANLACGYYEPHTTSEYIVLDQVHDTLCLVSELIDHLGDTVWSHEDTWSYRDYYKKSKKYDYDRWGDSPYDYYDYWSKGMAASTLGSQTFTYGASGTDAIREEQEFLNEAFSRDEVMCPNCQIEDSVSWSSVMGHYLCCTCGEILESPDDDATLDLFSEGEDLLPDDDFTEEGLEWERVQQSFSNV